jgi:hypothetical protein
MKYVVASLSVLLISCNSETGSRTETIDTPGGQLSVSVKTVEPTPQQVTVATADEVATLRSYAARASKFTATYVPEAEQPDLKALDEAFRRWQKEGSATFTEQEVVETLGASLGEKLVADLDMEWVVVTDQYGTDYGVRSKRSEVMAFPFSSVLKRIERNQHDFMVGVFHSVRSMIESGEYKSREQRNDG